MAAAKKTVKPVAVAAKVEAPKAEAKSVAPVTEVKAEVKEEVKETVKNAVEKKETVKKAPAKKEAVKKETVKEETKPAAEKKAPVKKAELKTEVQLQFDEKSYTQDDLVKIAKDVWKYDLNQKASDLTSVELYVKPQESRVYYVMNKEFKGSFYI